jgi:hypothetical protein
MLKENTSPKRQLIAPNIQFSTSRSASSFNIQLSTFNISPSVFIPMNESSTKTPPILVALAWIIVAIPLGWGLYQSIIKSEPLFKGAGAPPAQAAPAGPGK